MFDHVIIASAVTIGENTVIEPFTIIKEGVYIGDNCIIGAHCRIAPKCIIGNNCDIRSGALIGTNTILEDDVFLGAAVICTSPSFTDKTQYAQTVIERGVRIGAGTVILPGVRISTEIRVGAMSFVNRPLTKPGLYIGVPARPARPKESSYTQTCIPVDHMTNSERFAVIQNEMTNGQRLVAIKGNNLIFDNGL